MRIEIRGGEKTLLMPVTYAMTIPHGVKFGCSVLVVLLVVSSLLQIVGASRYRHREEGILIRNPRHRLRHRHDAASVMTSRRNNHEVRTTEDNSNDYEDAFSTGERNDYYYDAAAAAAEHEDEDYEMERSTRGHQPPSRGFTSHRSRYEPDFNSKHHRTAYNGDRWYRVRQQRAGRDGTRHNNERRFGYRSRSSSLDDASAPRRWRFDEDPEDDVRAHRSAGNLVPSGRRGRHQQARQEQRKDSRINGIWGGKRSKQKLDDLDYHNYGTKLNKQQRRKNENDSATGNVALDDVDDDDDDDDDDDENEEDVDDEEDAADDYVDDDDGENEGDEDGEDVTKKQEEEEEKAWNEEEVEEGEEEEEMEDEEDLFDTTNYYKTDKDPPYKTFDDIIKSLTSEDPTTAKPSGIRRDYRNTGIDKYLKRDVYGNIFDWRNASRPGGAPHDTFYRGKSIGSNSNRWRFHESKAKDATIGDLNSWKGRKESERRRSSYYSKWEASLSGSGRSKSLEQEYEEEYEDNEKDEDAAKIGRQRVSEMQADIDNTNYTDEENETESEDETTMPTTMTIPTTTSARPAATTRAPTVAHERKETSSQSNGLQPQSAHTIHKWQSSANHDSTKDSKGHGQQNNIKNRKAADIKEALQHARKVSLEGSCQWPRARVIPVRDVYPSPSTTYIPHCAILHRCSDDTGCCRSEAFTCVPKLSHRVELHFYTTSIGGAGVVEKLSFYNHTECECKERDEYGSVGGAGGAGTSEKASGTNEQRFTRHHANPVSPPPQNIRRPPPQRKPCRCPSEFTPRITPEGECQCNCFENHQNCIRTRRGKGYFSLRDRLCIQNEECATPLCEFGEYMRRQGKCPRKKDRFDAIANHPTNINLHHRYRN